MSNQELKIHATSIHSLEDGANHYPDQVFELETQLALLSSQIKHMTSKAEDLHSGQHRENVCIIGVEESLRYFCMEGLVAKLLQDALGLDYTPTLDQAHRSLHTQTQTGDLP